MDRTTNHLAVIRRAVALANAGRTFVIYDLETNGMRPPSARRGLEPEPRIYEIAAIKVTADGRRLEGVRLLNCEEPLSAEWCAKLGFPEGSPENEACRYRPVHQGDPAGPVLARFATFIDGAVLVGHNIEGFDNPVLAANMREHGIVPPDNLFQADSTIDTWPLAEAVLRQAAPVGGPVPNSLKLGTIGDFLGCTVTGDLHHALTDVRLCEDILAALLDRGVAIMSRLEALRTAGRAA